MNVLYLLCSVVSKLIYSLLQIKEKYYCDFMSKF